MMRLATSLLPLALPVRAALLPKRRMPSRSSRKPALGGLVINVAMGQDYANNDLAVPQGGLGFIWDRKAIS